MLAVQGHLNDVSPIDPAHLDHPPGQPSKDVFTFMFKHTLKGHSLGLGTSSIQL